MAVDSIIHAYIVREEVFQPGATIIEEGRSGDWVYVVLQGKVKVKKRTAKGMVTIDTLEEGAVVGEMVLLKGEGLRTGSVIAEGETTLGVLDRERLEREYESLAPELKSLIKTMVLRLEDVTKKISLLAMR